MRLHFRPEIKVADSTEKTNSRLRKFGQTLGESLRKFSKPIKVAVLALSLASSGAACKKSDNAQMEDAAQMNDAENDKPISGDVSMQPDAGIDSPVMGETPLEAPLPDVPKDMPADVAVDKAVDLAPDKMPDLAPDAAMWPVLDKPVIAFWAEDVKKMYLNTYVANAGDKSMVKLAVTGYGAFSPDGKKMAIASNGLLVMNYPDDSSRTTLVADDKSNYSNESQPKWSPDGKKIAYMFYVYNPDTFVGTDNLNIMAADGSGTPLSLFSSTSESIYSLSWSPAGDKVAFVTKQHGLDVYFRLYEAAADSSTPPAMLRNDDKYVGFGIGSVAYSPDGKTFFITKSENASGSKYGLYTVPASSPSDTPAMVDAVTMYNSEIEFSPDGTRVARGVKVSASLPQPCCDIAASNLDGTMLTTFFSSTTDIVVSPVISWNPASASK